MNFELPVISPAPVARRIRRITPLIKPTSRDCNLSCDYCFYLENPHVARGNRVRRMTEEVVRRFTESYLPIAPEEAMFAWQGGEPTMMGKDFFRLAFALQKEHCRPGQRTVNAFQTNAVLIDDEFAELLAEHEALVGVSLDGPEAIHDRHRLAGTKTKTWRKVMNAIGHMRRVGTEFNILCVLHRDNVKRIKDIYRFYRSEGFDYMQFIPCTEPELNRRGKPTGKLTKHSITPEEYGRFLVELFDMWEEDINAGQFVSIRFFDHVLHALAGYSGTMCLYNRQCDQQVVLEADGRMYPCDFFVQHKWQLGSILEMDLEDILDSPKYQDFIDQSLKMPKECGSCHYLQLCHGGCPKQRLLLRDLPADSNYFCSSYMTFFEHTVPRFESILQRLSASPDGRQMVEPLSV